MSEVEQNQNVEEVQQVEEPKEKKPLNKRFKHRWVGIVLNVVVGFFGTIIMVFGSFLAYAGATTLHTKPVEVVKVYGHASKAFNIAEAHSILTWNVGYCALDETADFFMDGGTGVRANSKAQVIANRQAITTAINEINPDICFIQELDIKSDRSKRVEQYGCFSAVLDTAHKYTNAFALNYKAGYVPYPLPTTLGKVESGIATYSKFPASKASRVQLPIPFKWPVSMLNLKRCLLVERVPIEGESKELVLINLHLEAYSDEAGKVKQFKMLYDIIDNEFAKGNYVIAGGDFNQVFSDYSGTYEHYGNNWEPPVINQSEYPGVLFKMDDATPTCRLLDKPYKGADHATFQYYMIDGFICTTNIEVDSVQTIDKEFKNTDHNPVLMNFHLMPVI